MRLRTLSEAAEALGVSRTKLRNGINAGRYPSMRWGQRTLVDLDVVGPIVEAEAADRERTVGIGEISRLTGLSAATIRSMCRDGVLPYAQDKRTRYRFRPSEVMAALQKMME